MVYVVIYHIGHAFMWSFATLLLAVYVVIYHISGGDQVVAEVSEVSHPFLISSVLTSHIFGNFQKASGRSVGSVAHIFHQF